MTGAPRAPLPRYILGNTSREVEGDQEISVWLAIDHGLSGQRRYCRRCGRQRVTGVRFGVTDKCDRRFVESVYREDACAREIITGRELRAREADRSWRAGGRVLLSGSRVDGLPRPAKAVEAGLASRCGGESPGAHCAG